jgi:Fe-S cluster biosynthesis and repair protein YggX
MARTVQCIKLGKEAEGLDYAPYPGELGKKIWESVSKEAWAGWMKHQTMLINDLAEQMEKYFFSGGVEVASGYVPQTNSVSPGNQDK